MIYILIKYSISIIIFPKKLEKSNKIQMKRKGFLAAKKLQKID